MAVKPSAAHMQASIPSPNPHNMVHLPHPKFRGSDVTNISALEVKIHGELILKLSGIHAAELGFEVLNSKRFCRCPIASFPGPI